MEEKNVEVINEEKQEVSTKDKIFKFCSDHADGLLGLLGGLAALASGILGVYVSKTEYNDNVFTTIEDDVYKIPCKRMKTAHNTRKEK